MCVRVCVDRNVGSATIFFITLNNTGIAQRGVLSFVSLCVIKSFYN